MKNVFENVAEIIENNNGRFVIMNGDKNVGSYSRRRDAVRAAARKGLVVA